MKNMFGKAATFKALISLILLLFTIGYASATCQSKPCDWYANVTFDNIQVGVTEVDLSGLYCHLTPLAPSGCSISYSNDNIKSTIYDVTPTVVGCSGPIKDCYVYDPISGTIDLSKVNVDAVFGSGLVTNYGLSLTTNKQHMIFNVGSYFSTDPKTVTLSICLNGSGSTYSYPIHNDVITNTISVSDSAFANYYQRRWVFRDDINNNYYNFTNQNATLNIYCDNYEQFNYNLSLVPRGGNLTLYTLEQPRYSAVVNSFSARIRQDAAHSLFDNYYLPTLGQTGSFTRYSILLNDYTNGLCSGNDATLSIQTTINNSVFGYVDVEKFDADHYAFPLLKNNTYYNLVVTCGSAVYNLGSYNFVDSQLSRSVSVSVPQINTMFGTTYGINYGWTDDYDNGLVGATTTSQDATVKGNFSVFITNSTPYVMIYSSTTSGSTNVYSYAVPDKAIPYYVTLEFNTPQYGLLQPYSHYIILTNRSMPLKNSVFNAPLPAELFPSSSTESIKCLAAMLITIFLFFITSKASSYSNGCLISLGFYFFMWWLNVIPQNRVSVWLIGYCLLLAFISKNYERVV